MRENIEDMLDRILSLSIFDKLITSAIKVRAWQMNRIIKREFKC